MSPDDKPKNVSKRTLAQLTRPDALLLANAWADAIRRQETIFVHSYYQEGPGSLIGTSPYMTLASAASAEHIGSAIRAALENSGCAERPTDGRAAMKATYAALGIHSQRELAIEAQVVSIAKLNGYLVVTPTESRGEEMYWNFVHVPPERIVLPENSIDRVIGEAIRTGWGKCTRGF